jgi:uncharacterized membrane protein YgdD (TMEM256/DUF423 family)
MSNGMIILYSGVGLIATSLISSTKLPFKIAVGAFLAGQICFVAPLYFTAANGRNEYLAKLMPAGGGSMMIGWASLLFT